MTASGCHLGRALPVWRLPYRRRLIGAATCALMLTNPGVAQGEVPLGQAQEEPLVVTVQGRATVPRTSSTTVLSAREIRSAPLRTADESLQLVPGLTLVQHGSEGKGHQLFLRGFDALHGADFEVSVEGISINEGSNVHAHGYIDLGFVVPEVIRQVRVTKGPFSVQQGPFAMAGSAEYRLGLPPDEVGWRLGYGYGSTGRHRVVGTYAPPSRFGDDFVALEAVRDTGFGSNRGLSKATLIAHTTVFDSARNGRLSLWSASYAAQFELPGSLRSEDVDSGAVDFFQSYDKAGGGRSVRSLSAAIYEYAAASRFVQARAFAGLRHLKLLENFTGFLLDPLHGDRRLQRHDSVKWGVDASDDVHWSSAFSTHVAAGVRQDVFSQSQEHIGQDREVLQLDQQLDATQTLAHVAVAGRLKLGIAETPRLRVEAGARLDSQHLHSDETSDAQWAWSPRLVAEVTATRELDVFAAYGRGARPPEARASFGYRPEQTGLAQDADSDGSPSWSQSHGTELGLRFRPSEVITSSLSAFFTAIERESVFDHVSGTNLELNSTQRMGSEVTVSVRATPWFSVSADATWAVARFVSSGRPVPFAPPLVAAVRGIVSHPQGWRAGLHSTAIAARPLPHGATGSASVQVDATLGYHWPRYRLDFAVENVLNQEWREGEYHHASNWRRNQSADQLPVLHFTAGSPFNARGMLTVLFE